jgi:outer membrane protein assembly factor BamB
MPSLRDSGAGPEAERPEYAGQYRLEARLGAGGMGVVHLARSSSGLLLAVKVIHAEFAQDPEFRGRFRQEVAAARRVSGAFTAPVVDADPDAGRPWMATLHIPGPTLSDHVKRNGPLPPAAVLRLASGLAEALRDIHRAGVVHRDLTPGNVLLATDGPKVIDFGISRPSDSEMRTETGKLIGTPPFMAPEQFQRPREVGPAADVFALGSVLVHAATGSGPFDSHSPYLVAYQVVHDEADLTGVPRELVPLVESCLAKDPADRPTPDALMELLRTDVPTQPHIAPLHELLAWTRGGPAEDGPAEGTPAEGGPVGNGPVGDGPVGDGPVGDGPTDSRGATDRTGAADGAGATDGAGAAPGPAGSPAAGPVRQPRVPGQRQPVRDRTAAARAEDTHVRARTPDFRPGRVRTLAPPAAAPAAAPPAAARTAGARTPAADGPGPAGPAAPGSPLTAGTAAGRRARPRRRWPVWVAVGLAVAGAGTFAGVRAVSGGVLDHAPALETHPPRTGPAAFRPWRTPLLQRPTGYAAEMPFCTAGTGGDAPSAHPAPAVFCVQSGVQAARLDPDTGRVVWRRTGGPAGKADAPPSAPVLSGGLLYVFSPDGTRLAALDPSADGQGATRWTQDLTGYPGGAAVIGDRVLLAAGDGTVTALDSATHRQRWRKHFPGHAPAVFTTFDAGRTAYAATPAADGTGTQVTAIDPRDGTVHWARRLAGSLTPAGTGAAGALYLTAADPKLDFRTSAVVRHDPRTGRTERLPLTAPLDGVAAVVRGETVYLLAEGGALQAVGERTWDLETSVSRGSAPVAAADGRLYFTAADGRLLAVDAAKGALLGQTRPRLAADRHHGFLESLPAPLVDAARGRIYAAAPDGTVFGTATEDPARW